MGENSNKRNSKVFLQMADYIGTKTPSQCRSHHQKFYKKLIRSLRNPGEIKKKKEISKKIKN